MDQDSPVAQDINLNHFIPLTLRENKNTIVWALSMPDYLLARTGCP